MDRDLFIKQLKSITDGVGNPVSNMANISSLIYHSFEHINWAGFYILKDDILELGPFQGKVACTVIPVGKGVCGTAVSQNRVIIVDDVDSFPGHIACDADSRSEMVIPVYKDEKLFGVLDIDSDIIDRFDLEDSSIILEAGKMAGDLI